MKHTNNEIWFAEQRDMAIDERDAAIARAERAEGELAALRAQLAEGEWRPVTDKPESDDLYVTLKIKGYWRNGLFRARSGDEIWDIHVLGWQYTED